MKVVLLLVLAGVLLLSGCIQQETAQPEPQAPLKAFPELRAQLLGCSFEEYAKEGKGRFEFFFKILNDGDVTTKVPAWVCLGPENSKRPHCLSLNQAYYDGQVLWGDINWSDGRVGQEWSIEGNDSVRRDYEYTLFYTEDQYEPMKDALTLYSGTTESCRTVEH